jgi:hypothetical protein
LNNLSLQTRRQVLANLAGLAGLSSVVAGCSRRQPQQAAPQPPAIGKKGLCLTTKGDDWHERLASLDCEWFYTWGSRRPPETPEGVAFTPMIWGHWGDDEKIAKAGREARESGIKELLGFNEPDKKDQSNLSVERALKAWPLLEATGLRLGSPACVHPDTDWMQAFMKRADTRGLRVDFVCVHTYHGPNVEALVRRLTETHRMYGKPIWITEFAVGDWEAKSVEQNRHKPEKILRFMEKALPALEKLEFVERYAWFPAKPDNGALGTSALFDEEGGLTPLGECYRDFTA